MSRLHPGLPILLIPLFIISPWLTLTGNVIKQLNGPEEKGRLLANELKLAMQGKAYIILDTTLKRVYLKNRGITLREFDIIDTRHWGERKGVSGPIALLEKRSLFKPERKEIKPPPKDREPVDTLPLESLELKDMPSNYTLLFEKGVSISVRATHGEGVIGWPKYLCLFMLRHIHYSFRTVWNYMRGKPFTMIELTMDKEDAQALFWTLQEGTNILITEVPSHDTP